MKTVSSINAEEVAKFEKLANEWWDAEGKFKPLHMLNPCRLEFITDHLSLFFEKDMVLDKKPLKGIRVLDIGCGGGLLCEPLSKLGAQVVGINASEKNIKIAKLRGLLSPASQEIVHGII